MSRPVVCSTARCIFPEGKPVLVAYDEHDKLIMGVTAKLKQGETVAQWMLRRDSVADLGRMTREVAETFDETGALRE